MVSISVEKRDEYSLGFKETELCLGLPRDGEATKKGVGDNGLEAQTPDG